MLNGAANKLEDVVNFHVGDSITALQRSSLQPGGQEVLVYSTLLGSLGSLLPFVSREDWDFFSHLEMHMRQELPPLSGREHMAFRGSFFPVKDVIDGDLCEQYSLVRPPTRLDLPNANPYHWLLFSKTCSTCQTSSANRPQSCLLKLDVKWNAATQN